MHGLCHCHNLVICAACLYKVEWLNKPRLVLKWLDCPGLAAWPWREQDEAGHRDQSVPLFLSSQLWVAFTSLIRNIKEVRRGSAV